MSRPTFAELAERSSGPADTHAPTRSRRGLRRPVTRAVALAGSVALVATLTACVPSAPPIPYYAPQGVTENEILLGSHQPLSGPAASGYSRVSMAMKAYFDYVNSKGGVHGRTIVYLARDDEYNPAKTQTVVRDLVEKDKVFAIVGGLGTPTHSAVLDYLKEEQIPDLFVASGATTWNQPARYPGTFGFQTDYTTEGKIIGHYLKTTASLADQKTCSLVQEDDFGRQLLAGVEASLGTTLPVRESYITSNANVAPQVGKLELEGCQVVVLGTIPTFTSRVISTAAALNYRPQWIVSTAGGDYGTVAEHLGVYKNLLEGVISTGYLPLATDEDDPWIQLFGQINDEFGDGDPVDNNVVVGMSIAYLTVQALQRAGREITVDNLIAAIEQGGFRGPGLVPFAFSPTSHAGYSGVRMSKVTNGVQGYFGPAYVSDAGLAAVQEYPEGPVAPPEGGVPSS